MFISEPPFLICGASIDNKDKCCYQFQELITIIVQNTQLIFR